MEPFWFWLSLDAIVAIATVGFGIQTLRKYTEHKMRIRRSAQILLIYFSFLLFGVGVALLLEGYTWFGALLFGGILAGFHLILVSAVFVVALVR